MKVMYTPSEYIQLKEHVLCVSNVSVRYLYFFLLCFQEKCFGLLKTFKVNYSPLDNLKTSRVNNSRVLWIRNGKFSGYCFHMSPNI